MICGFRPDGQMQQMFILWHVDSEGCGMGAMGVSGRAGIIILVIAFLAPCVLAAIPVAGSTAISNSPGNVLAATQYGPSVLFQPDVCINDYSWAISTDLGVVDGDTGYLNGDGLKDIAVISDHSYSVCIYNRTAMGTLDPNPWRIALSNVSELRSIAIGDLDEDGSDDIAVSYVDISSEGRLCILFQSSQFSLSSALIKNISPEPQKTIIGEFDHLGNSSILTVCAGDPLYSDDYIDIWRYPFGAPSKDHYYFPVDASPQFTRSKYLSSGDINGDGYSDFIVGNESGNNVFIAYQPSSWKASWTTTTKSISGEASDVKLADVMGAGRNDLLFANSLNSMIYVYRNTGSGPSYFGPTPEVPLQAYATLSNLAVGEFSSGLGVDILAFSDSNNASAFMRSSGSGWFTSSPTLKFPVNANPLKAIIDRTLVDEEGIFIICQGTAGSNGSIEFFNSHPSLEGNADQNIFMTAKDPTRLASGKLLNGNVVVAATLPGSNQIQLIERNTSELFLLTTPSTPLDLTFGNFDDDGIDDLAVLCSGPQISIFPGYQLMSETNPIKNVTLTLSSPQSILAANLRENGRSDLVVSYDGGCQVIYNSLDIEPFNSTPLTEAVGTSISGLRTVVISADLNSDSYLGDLAILNRGASKVEIYPRNVAGSIPDIYPDTPLSTLTGGVGLVNMTTGDFGGTSDQDIAVTDVNMRVQIFLQPSYGFIIDLPEASIVFDIPDYGSRITSGDLNDDGKSDLLIGYKTIPAVAAFLRNVDSFINVYNLTCGGNASDIMACDVNGDLRTDIACASPISHALSFWYQNNLVPKAVGAASQYTIDEGNSITFTGSSSTDSYSDKPSLEYNWTFLPSNFETGITVAHTYPQNGTFHVSLRVTDRGGLSNWSNLTITIRDTVPTADFSFLPASPVENTLVQFNDTSIKSVDQIVSYHWAFGDGGESTLRNASHTYQQNGNYLVILTIRDADGSESTKQRTVAVSDTNPNVDFSISPNPAVEGTEVTFQDESTPGHDAIVDRFWTFGDGGSAHGIQVQHIYAQNGVYQVTLTVNDTDSSIVGTPQTVTITDIDPIAEFSFIPVNPNEGVDVQFTDESTSYDNITTWLWDFDDGSTSTLSNPTHTFANNGTYNVTLTVWEADGDSDSIVHNITVNDIGPLADFTISNPRIEGVPIFFNDTSISVDPLIAWNWSFGDGGYSDQRNASHNYTANDYYLIVLKVWDWDGDVSSTSTYIRVLDSGPKAAFSYWPTQPKEGETVYFNDTSTHVDRLNRWSWSLGGLGTSTSNNTQQSFPTGRFNITLTVWDVDGNQSSCWTIITVGDLPLTAGFDNSTPIEGSRTNFTDISFSPYYSISYFNWTFGDGAIASGAQVWHIYNRSGNFVVSLSITDSNGTSASTSRTISVIDVDPSANFYFTPTDQHEGDVVQFNDTSFSFNRITSWAWNFGDGKSSTLKNPVHTYLENGTYNVSLTVVEFDGSSGTHYELVSIADTSPVIYSLGTLEGRRSYAEDETATFEVVVIIGSDQLAVNHTYQWDLNFNGSFTSTPVVSLVDHIPYQFSKNGTYRVSVRVWDDDNSYRETSPQQVLLIEITDPRPTAAFNYHNVTSSSGTIQLDASSSSDNPSDVDGLLFSWNFDDGSGYSAWNATLVFNHHFALDGSYTVTLRVKDDSNQIDESTRIILIDRIAPEVVLSGDSTNFYVGEAIHISVTVSDLNAISSVILHYSIDNATEQTLSMTRSGAPGVYVAEILPQDHNCTIAYWVTATDSSSNVETTGQLVITVSVFTITTEYVFLWVTAILIIVAVLLLFMRNTMVPVDEVFIIYNDGRLMAHQTRRLKPGMDDDILSSMLVAIQGFVKDSFKDESSTHLQRLDFGEKKILVERGESFYLAVVLHSHRAGNVPQRMQAVIEDIHLEYGLALKEWDGDLEKVRGVKDQTERLFKSPIPLALPSLKKEKSPEHNVCQVCGSVVPLNAQKCPNCGSDFPLPP
jgi:PKD repeat protein